MYYLFSQELIFQPEIFQSVYLSQQSIKLFEISNLFCSPFDETSNEWNEAAFLWESIFSDPQLVIASSSRDVVDYEFIKGKTFEMIEPSDSRYVQMDIDPSTFSIPLYRPYALTYVIQTEREGGKPCLSRQV